MKVVLSERIPAGCGALVVFCEQNAKAPKIRSRQLSPAALRALKRVAEEEHFRGKLEQTLLWHVPANRKLRKVVLAGLGEPPWEASHIVRAAGAALRKASEAGSKTVAVDVASVSSDRLTREEVVQKVAEGSWLGQYRFDRYFSQNETPKPVDSVSFVGVEKTLAKAAQAAARRGEIFSRATALARDLINEPASVKTPTRLAEVAKGLAEQGIRVNIFQKREIEKLGMGGLLGVAMGSEQPPVFIRLHYKPPQVASRKVALVGKGITFDSGGLCIKPAESMETMKYDMSGAAAILGIFHALGTLRPSVEVLGFLPCTENMPGGRAYRPGDVLKMYGGKTVEVTNTDAEGRLVLADALAYALTEKPDEIIDLATLTGACVVALGRGMCGVMGNDQELSDRLLVAARRAGEKAWPLPLELEYKEALKSEVADIKNSGGRHGGAILGAIFLREFVGKTPWAHLDIAGPAWTEKANALSPPGATGFGVRTLLEYLTGPGQ